jgi:hypothetical protein
MEPEANRERANGGLLGFLRGVALVAVVTGAVGSLGLMLRAGHPPLFLRVLFAIWVLSPFVALLVAQVVSKRWPVLIRATLHSLMLIVTAGSLAFYGNVVFGPPRPKPASVFLLVPLTSWLVMTIAAAIAALILRKRGNDPLNKTMR